MKRNKMQTKMNEEWKAGIAASEKERKEDTGKFLAAIDAGRNNAAFCSKCGSYCYGDCEA